MRYLLNSAWVSNCLCLLEDKGIMAHIKKHLRKKYLRLSIE